MTSLPSLRPPSRLARGALVVGVLAAGAGTAFAQGGGPAGAPGRTAVLAGPDASQAAVTRAVASAQTPAEVRRVGGALEAQATAASLAAEGYTTVIGVGPSARTAVGQAAGGEVGDGIRWDSRR